MKFWIIAMKDVKIRLRDRRGLLVLFLMPLVLTLILGSALGGVLNDESVSMPSMKLAVYNGDSGDLGKALADEVFKSDSLKPYITLQSATTPDQVSQAVAAGQADAGVVIPANFSQDVTSGKNALIGVVQDPGKSTVGSIVNAIVTSFSDRVSTVTVASKTAMTDLAAKLPETPVFQTNFPNGSSGSQPVVGTFALTRFARDLGATLQQTSQHPNTSVAEKPVGAKAVNAKQYYAAGMAVMFLMFNATIGAKSILNERDTETLARLMSTPTSKTSILLGKFTGTLIFAVLQFVVLLVATRYGFGVNWGSDLLQIGSIVLGYSIAVSGISMVIASLTGSAQNADMISQIVIQIFAILGGSMAPLSVFPELMRKLALITPNAWALTSLTDIMTGTAWSTLWLPIGVLVAIGLLTLSIGTWRLQAVRR